MEEILVTALGSHLASLARQVMVDTEQKGKDAQTQYGYAGF